MNAIIRRGFTIVELMVVIVVIVILALITAVVFTSVREQAEDTKVADAAVKVADALQLFSAKYGHAPKGGYGSTTAITGNECADGSNGFATSGVYACTVEDSLAASGYLPQGYMAALPKNTLYNPASTKNLSIMVYIVTVSGKSKAMVFYTMRAASEEDTTKFNNQLTQCGYNPSGTISQRDAWGMRNGICVSL